LKAGDRIEAVTKAVGIEPCKGCQERKLLFNRRGWIGGTAATLYLAKNALLTKMWEVAGAEVEVSVHAARAFIGQFTTISRWYLLEYGHHGELADVMTTLVTHVREHFKDNPDDMFEWLKALRPASKEPLAGWTIDYAIIKKGYPREGPELVKGKMEYPDGYRLILPGREYTIISDENAGISFARTTSHAPAAKDLTWAPDYPGAKENVSDLKQLSVLNRMSR
jgi:hypothetical protein